jgi:hypothetical protein
MSGAPKDWVLIEGAKKCGWDYFNDLRTMYSANSAFRALCDMIAKHEQKPVDRKLLCAEEALRVEWLHDPQGTTATGQCIRAIELWEEGFGK